MTEYWLISAVFAWVKLMISGDFLAAEPWRVYLSVWLEQHWQQFGTPFQQHVWSQINQINFGETKSYGHIALLMKKPKAYRAVANACGANPWPFLVPCHRVVATGFGAKSWRNLGGYGYGISLKRALLTQELQMR